MNKHTLQYLLSYYSTKKSKGKQGGEREVEVVCLEVQCMDVHKLSLELMGSFCCLLIRQKKKTCIINTGCEMIYKIKNKKRKVELIPMDEKKKME